MGAGCSKGVLSRVSVSPLPDEGPAPASAPPQTPQRPGPGHLPVGYTSKRRGSVRGSALALAVAAPSVHTARRMICQPLARQVAVTPCAAEPRKVSFCRRGAGVRRAIGGLRRHPQAADPV